MRGTTDDASQKPVLTAEDKCLKGRWVGDKVSLDIILAEKCPDYVGSHLFR